VEQASAELDGFLGAGFFGPAFDGPAFDGGPAGSTERQR
jgi:histidine ammonia-lyase